MSASTEGSLDEDGNRVLIIQLPNGKSVEATVDPSLKMMDLLISIASTNKLNPSAYQIAQPSKYKGRPPNVYTPSQSAGDITGNTIMLVAKKEREQYSIYKGNKKSGVFEHTVRLTIHSSKNHQMVFRTNPEKTLAEVLPKICENRGVDAKHHIMRVHKQKADADPSKTIESFGTLEFDLVEADGENKRKSGLFGKFKKKEDGDEKREKVKTMPPTSNGSHVKRELPDETRTSTQSNLDASTSHKKRPAPLPPSAAAAAPPPDGVQPQVDATDKSVPNISRAPTKKRRAPPVPAVIVPVNSDEAPKDEVSTPTDEVDAAPMVLDGSNEGFPPSPAFSHGSSQDSSNGLLIEQNSTGSRPSKPPRLNLYSYDVIDADLPLDDKPVFVPPSPPPTPPSASVPRWDIQKLIAEGRLSIEEEIAGDSTDSDVSSSNPDRVSMNEDTDVVESSYLEEDNNDIIVARSESVNEKSGEEILQVGSSSNGDAYHIYQRDSFAAESSATLDSDNKGHKSQDEVKVEVSDSREDRGNQQQDSSSPRVVESDEPSSVAPAASEALGNDPPADEFDGGNDPPSDKPPRRVCKCIDPENGEDCDHTTPGAVLKPGSEKSDLFLLNGSSVGGSDKPQEDGKDEEPDSGSVKSENEVKGKDAPSTINQTVDDKNNKTTSYSILPQEEDFANEMEDKSLQMSASAPGLIKVGNDESNTQNTVAYQMQTDPVPEDVHNLKEMYQQMQKQLIELQQTMLISQQQPSNQGSALQLQQLQQQLLLQQQQLLAQQGMMPQSLMMPPMMMQQNIHSMPFQMSPQAVVMPSYMVPSQQPVVVMQQSHTVPAQPVQTSNKDESLVNQEEAVTRADMKPSLGVESQEPDVNIVSEKEAQTSSIETKNTSTKEPHIEQQQAPASKTSPIVQQFTTPKEETKTVSPSSRRKNVFADIIKKKGKPTSNYVLSAQREMLNRQRSSSDVKTNSVSSSSHVSEIPRTELGITSKEADTTPKLKEVIDKSNSEVDLGGKLSAGSSSSVKINGNLGSGEIPKTDNFQSKSQTMNIVNETGSKTKEEGSSPTINDSQVKHINNQSNGKPTALQYNNNAVITEAKTKTSMERAPAEEKLVRVSSFEAHFAEERSSKVQQGGSNETAHLPPKVAAKPVRKPVGKSQSQDPPRPFRRSTRPVALVSDQHGELKEMASLNSVSRLKEMMEALNSKENTD